MSLVHDLAAQALHMLQPERAHRLTVAGLKLGLGPRDGGLVDPALSVRLAGLDLPNCIGLAAGFDKDAEVFNPMLSAGFGFVECGTVTPLPQAGNPQPRLFRLRRDKGVINRMGFNNCGLEPFAERLNRSKRGVVGANLGANKESEDRIGDYVVGLERLWGRCDYFTVNVSSPNTPGLRSLQSRTALEELAGRLKEARRALIAASPGAKRIPIFLKVAPDLQPREVVDIVAVCDAFGIEGAIVANTSVDRPEMLRSHARKQTGGLSGAPIRDLSLRTLRLFNEANEKAGLALIGAGGVASGSDAYAKIRAGACAIQLYTALTYAGPGLVRRIKRDLAMRLRADGFVCVDEACGVG